MAKRIVRDKRSSLFSFAVNDEGTKFLKQLSTVRRRNEHFGNFKGGTEVEGRLTALDYTYFYFSTKFQCSIINQVALNKLSLLLKI